MSPLTSTDDQKRSPLGQLVKWSFIGFNILMVIWLVHGIEAISQVTTHSDAARAGKAIGATIGFAMILGIWVVGDIILGIFVLLTRRSPVVGKAAASDWRTSKSLDQEVDADGMIARYLERKEVQERPRSSAPPPATPSFGRRR